ncbi:MAG: YncE family protein [Chloroflexi bacterium]|nr:MAG: YncE family protein [Chloroflexota bacterium]
MCFAIAIVSPAAVVAAVVWNAPPVTAPPAQADLPPIQPLAPPDAGTGSLPKGPLNVYANDMSGVVPCPLCNLPPRVYVPNSDAGTVDVIDPRTFKVIDTYSVGQIPHHITPSWDMRELYVENEGSSSLTVLDIHTGKPVRTISIPFPYNLYFTPDGTKAIDVVERQMKIQFRDPHTWKLIREVPIPWPGADHLDFSADGSYMLISTEYSGIVAKVDVVHMKLAGYVNVGGLPIDVKVSPDGSVFYVTNQGSDGVSIDFTTRKVVTKWVIPGGGSPDMLQLNPDGTQLWASGRYNATVYVISTVTGQVLARIRVGAQDHGLTYFPNVGLHSIGHNGVYR